jgi:hypothetical protein
VTVILTIERPAEVGGPWEIKDGLTIFEAGVLYGDRYPDNRMLEYYLEPNHPGGRNLAEQQHGLGPPQLWISEEPWNPAPRDVYLQLIDMVTNRELRPLKAAYFGPGEIDPFRTVIPLTALLELARSRGDAGSAVTDLARRGSVKPNPPIQRRRHGGRNYASTDASLIDEMHKLIAAGTATSPFDAARQVAERAEGGGTLESKVKRLVGRYSEPLGSEPNGVD